MIKVDVNDAVKDFHRIIEELQSGRSGVVYILRDGRPIVEMNTVKSINLPKRADYNDVTGDLPDEYDGWEEELSEMFGDDI